MNAEPTLPEGWTMNLVCCTQVILQDVGAAQATQKDVALTYAMAIKSQAQGADKPDWKVINTAIIARSSGFSHDPPATSTGSNPPGSGYHLQSPMLCRAESEIQIRISLHRREQSPGGAHLPGDKHRPRLQKETGGVLAGVLSEESPQKGSVMSSQSPATNTPAPIDRTIWHLATASGSGPKCGRQLSRPALTTANQASMKLTTDLAEVKCRHCLRAVRLLPPVARRIPAEDAEEDTEAEREIDRGMIPLDQDEDEEE